MRSGRPCAGRPRTDRRRMFCLQTVGLSTQRQWMDLNALQAVGRERTPERTGDEMRDRQPSRWWAWGLCAISPLIAPVWSTTCATGHQRNSCTSHQCVSGCAIVLTSGSCLEQRSDELLTTQQGCRVHNLEDCRVQPQWFMHIHVACAKGHVSPVLWLLGVLVVSGSTDSFSFTAKKNNNMQITNSNPSGTLLVSPCLLSPNLRPSSTHSYTHTRVPTYTHTTHTACPECCSLFLTVRAQSVPADM